MTDTAVDMADDDDDFLPPPRHRRHRWMWVVLGLSLAVNALTIGTIAGHSFFKGVPPVLQEFPPEVRPIMAEVINDHLSDLRPAFRPLRVAERTVAASIAADPFDEAQLAVDLAELRERDAVARYEVHQVLLDLAGRISPEARQILADRPEWRSFQRSGDRRLRNRDGNRGQGQVRDQAPDGDPEDGSPD